MRIANRMRKGVHTLIAVEECIKNYLSIHYANAYSAEVSNTFSQIKTTLWIHWALNMVMVLQKMIPILQSHHIEQQILYETNQNIHKQCTE